ncbi:MAG: translation initiation factor IF-2 [Parcubacteria group bacterium]|nr:translation initiation factor IF-2 [Parcubacteria group bacterium]
MPQSPKNQNNLIERPPIVVVMGHIDHGKSTLLDFLRKTNVVAGEAGGITQHTYSYEVTHAEEGGVKKRITFLDTPGHEAFTLMRSRGASVADVAVLVVAVNEGVKPQTREALAIIKKNEVPFVVALNKIDAPNANVDKVKQELAEHEVYLEGYGGSVPVVAISAKTGENVPALLDMILLVAELEELKGDPALPAEGVVVEAHQDPQKGISATLVIKNGTLKKKTFVVARGCRAPVRRIDTILLKDIPEASFSTPVIITGWNCIPEAGAEFVSLAGKKEAETLSRASLSAASPRKNGALQGERETADEAKRETIPLVLKADMQGTLDALVYETDKVLAKLKETHGANVDARIVHSGVGAISESDVNLVSGNENAVIAGFNVSIDAVAKEIAERNHTSIGVFAIIYELTDWLAKEIEKKRPRVHIEEITGKAKILRTFSRTKNKQIVGGRVLEGKIVKGGNTRILRRDFSIGEGEVLELQQQKNRASEIAEGSEFGAMIESRHDIAPGDVIEEFITKEQ